MTGDIRKCIAILCFVLSVVNVSALISDRQPIRNFLSEYNRQYEILINNRTELRWNLYFNNSEDAREFVSLEKLKLINFYISKSLQASRFNLTCISKSDVRQLQQIMDLGFKAANNFTKQERLNQVHDAIRAIYQRLPFPDGSKLYDLALVNKSYDVAEAVWLTKADTWGRGMKDLFTEYVNLKNELVQLLGYADLGDFRRSSYEIPTFEDDVHRLYDQIRPLWEHVHAYLRRRLIALHDKDKFPSSGHIPHHLFDTMLRFEFRQSLIPFPGKPTIDVTAEMENQNYTVEKMYEIADEFFKSLGMKAATPEFWNKSLFYKVPGVEPYDCSPASWDFFNGKDYRLKVCGDVSARGLYLAHELMGYIQYFMQYAHQPVIFRNGANPAFPRALSLAIALFAMTQEYLHTIGLLDSVVNDTESDVNILMGKVLERAANLPYAFKNDLWKWKVFRGDITPENYNEAWWNMTCSYLGVSEPVQGSSDILYASLTFDIVGDSSSIDYFLAEILQHQIHKALCDASGYRGPLHKCQIYNNKEAGKKLSETLKLGSSKPWPEVLEVLTGQSKIDAAPYLEYYQPVMDYLKTVNQDDRGWKCVCPIPKPKLCKAAIPGNCTCENPFQCEGRGCCKNGICTWD